MALSPPLGPRPAAAHAAEELLAAEGIEPDPTTGRGAVCRRVRDREAVATVGEPSPTNPAPGGGRGGGGPRRRGDASSGAADRLPDEVERTGVAVSFMVAEGCCATGWPQPRRPVPRSSRDPGRDRRPRGLVVHRARQALTAAG